MSRPRGKKKKGKKHGTRWWGRWRARVVPITQRYAIERKPSKLAKKRQRRIARNPPTIVQLVVHEHLLPNNLWKEALSFSSVTKHVYEDLFAETFRVLLWKEEEEDDGELVLNQRVAAFMAGDPRLEVVRHLVTTVEERAIWLGRQLKERGGMRLLSAASPDGEGAVVHLFSPNKSTSLFRSLEREVQAVAYVRSKWDPAVISLLKPEEQRVNTVTIITHFDEKSRGTGIPITTSNEIVSRIQRDVNDMTNEAPPTPSIFKHILHIRLEPNRQCATTTNPFPTDTIAGLGRALSARNLVEQESLIRTRKPCAGASLCIDGFASWACRDSVVHLIKDLCDSTYPALNLRLKLVIHRLVRDPKQTPEEMDSLVDDILPAYAGFLQRLLRPMTEGKGEYGRYLASQPCNPQMEIVFRHLSGSVQTLLIHPKPCGESVIVSYSEDRKWRKHERWRAVMAADGIECEELDLEEE